MSSFQGRKHYEELSGGSQGQGHYHPEVRCSTGLSVPRHWGIGKDL